MWMCGCACTCACGCVGVRACKRERARARACVCVSISVFQEASLSLRVVYCALLYNDVIACVCVCGFAYVRVYGCNY